MRRRLGPKASRSLMAAMRTLARSLTSELRVAAAIGACNATVHAIGACLVFQQAITIRRPVRRSSGLSRIRASAPSAPRRRARRRCRPSSSSRSSSSRRPGAAASRAGRRASASRRSHPGTICSGGDRERRVRRQVCRRSAAAPQRSARLRDPTRAASSRSTLRRPSPATAPSRRGRRCARGSSPAVRARIVAAERREARRRAAHRLAAAIRHRRHRVPQQRALLVHK